MLQYLIQDTYSQSGECRVTKSTLLILCCGLFFLTFSAGITQAQDNPNDPSGQTRSPNVTCYVDADGDGYGDPGNTVECAIDCSCQPGLVDNDLDCDDTDPNVNPGATETCNTIDDDCNGTIDDNAIDCTNWYPDLDSDGYGDAGASPICDCTQPPGYVDNGFDCNDLDANVNPAATETCNTIDDDCNGTIDDNAVDCTDWYPDFDGDGFGDMGSPPDCDCSQPPGYVDNNLDCDDGNSGTHPGATEVCNDVDDDCNGTIDDNAVDCIDWYPDADGDGYGDNASSPICECSQPPGYADNNGDCDDGDAEVNPGALEFCSGLDNDCNGTIDDNAVDCINWYPDNDGDGFGNASAQASCLCESPPGYVADNGDCDDSDASINPAAEDIPGDEIDQDCDGSDAQICCDVPGDANNDGSLNVGDAVFIINHVFKGGPAPICD
jgi:hypothetical protein